MTIDGLIKYADEYISLTQNASLPTAVIYAQIAQAAALTAQAKLMQKMINLPFGDNGVGYLRIQETPE